MKKILIGFILVICSLTAYNQTWNMPVLSTFANGEQMNAIRNKLNSNATTTTTYVNRAIDSLYQHNIRLLAIESGAVGGSGGLTLGSIYTNSTSSPGLTINNTGTGGAVYLSNTNASSSALDIRSNGGPGLYMVNTSGNYGIFSSNASAFTGYGLYMTVGNSTNGGGIYINNTGAVPGLSVVHSGTSYGVSISKSVSGEALRISGSGSGEYIHLESSSSSSTLLDMVSLYRGIELDVQGGMGIDITGIAAVGRGINIVNTQSMATGIHVANSSSNSYGIYSTNSGTGLGTFSTTTSSGTASQFTSSGTSSGKIVRIANAVSTTGKMLEIVNTATAAYPSDVKSIDVTDGTSSIFSVDRDSVRFPYLTGGDVWLTLTNSPNGAALDTNNWDPASEMVRMALPSLKEHLTDTISGEYKWYQYNKETKKVEFTYGLEGVGPRKAAHIFQGAIELGYRWTYEAYKQIEEEKCKRILLENKVSNLEDRVKMLEKVLIEHLDKE